VPSIQHLLSFPKNYDKLVDYFNSQWIHMSVAELDKQSYMIVGLALVATILCLVIIFLMRYVAQALTIVLLVMSCVGCVGMSSLKKPQLSCIESYLHA
jgi:hypothetical protein